jgi:hypothetical protein
VKPNLSFDLFTIQNSNLLSDGAANPSFLNFGLAWYQSYLQADSNGNVHITIKTILLDQIFGFDPSVGLVPTNTFHVGFWFNNPNDAVACGFDPTKPTPFNGEHKAGPNAMISLPNQQTNLGRCVPHRSHRGRTSSAASRSETSRVVTGEGARHGEGHHHLSLAAEGAMRTLLRFGPVVW